MLSQLNEYFQYFSELTKSNPVFAGLIGAAGIGAVIRWGVAIPKSIAYVFNRLFTRTLLIRSQDPLFYVFEKFITDKVISITVQNYTVGATSHAMIHTGAGVHMLAPDADSSRMAVPGNGVQIMRWNNKLFKILRLESKENQTEKTKESFLVSVLSINSNIFNSLIKAITLNNKSLDKIKLFKPDYDSWSFAGEILKREWESIALSEENNAKIIKHIDNFIAEEAWCKERSMPYRTGIILEGPPGTGKTTLVQGICSKYNKPLYILNPGITTDEGINTFMRHVPYGSVICIEDIDVTGAPISRDKDASTGDKLTLSGLLNAIDGITSGFGTIVIATTNNINGLDPALTRPGRFDLILHVGYLDQETFQKYMNFLYQTSINMDGYLIKDGITPAQVQVLVKDNKDNYENVLKEVCTKLN